VASVNKEGAMDQYMNEEVRKRRRRKLVEGKCDKCDEEAMIPWYDKKFCYRCWDKFWQKERRCIEY